MRNEDGRFAKNNKIALGNKGNTKSETKKGNANAMKYGHVVGAASYLDGETQRYCVVLERLVHKMRRDLALIDALGNVYIRRDKLEEIIDISQYEVVFRSRKDINSELENATFTRTFSISPVKYL